MAPPPRSRRSRPSLPLFHPIGKRSLRSASQGPFIINSTREIGMKPEQWRQIESLYYTALERDVTEREAFLAEACAGDEELRREVESLLAVHEQAEGFMSAT